MRIRYRVDDVPARGVGAFSPTTPQTPRASSWGLARVIGAPGTLAVHSPAPSALPPVSMDPRTQGHNVSPDVIRPALYVALADNLHGPVQTRHHNNIPAPSIGWWRVPLVAFRRPSRIGGRRVIPWPRTFQRFPSITKTPSA